MEKTEGRIEISMDDYTESLEDVEVTEEPAGCREQAGGKLNVSENGSKLGSRILY